MNDIIAVSFDVETTGCMLNKHAMVELGAVAFNISHHIIIDKFSVLINIPPGRSWEDRCLNEFWNNNDWIHLDDSDSRKLNKKEEYERLQQKKENIDKNSGIDPREAMEKFDYFVSIIFNTMAGGQLHNFMFVSDSTSFDCSWINLYLAEYLDHPPLHLYFSTNTKLLYKDVVNSDNVARGLTRYNDVEIAKIEKEKGYFSSDNNCRKRLAIPENDVPEVPHNHDAVNDAEYIIREHCIHMKWCTANDK